VAPCQGARSGDRGKHEKQVQIRRLGIDQLSENRSGVRGQGRFGADTIIYSEEKEMVSSELELMT
jgi:hypothetical protein